jgi:hypothetical protein
VSCAHGRGLWRDARYDRATWIARLRSQNAATKAIGEMLAAEACELGHVQVSQRHIARRLARLPGWTQGTAYAALRKLSTGGLTRPVAGGDEAAKIAGIIALVVGEDSVNESCPTVERVGLPKVYRWDPKREMFEEPIEATEWLLEHRGNSR